MASFSPWICVFLFSKSWKPLRLRHTDPLDINSGVPSYLSVTVEHNPYRFLAMYSCDNLIPELSAIQLGMVE